MSYRSRLFSPFLLRLSDNTPPWRPHRSLSFSSSSSSSSSAAEGDGFLSFFDGGGGGEESPAYRRHLRCHRPPTVRPWHLPTNTCSLIGTVAASLRRCDSCSGRVGAYTWLQVDKPPRVSAHLAFSPFEILVMMWDELAEVSLKHLKPNDVIYVSGHLSSYEKVDGRGKKQIRHKVIVKDLNYVQHTGKILPSQNPRIIDEDDASASSSDETSEDTDQEREHRDRLRLWQTFFANPREWWDNRHQKPYQSSPDFKHRHTRECLSLSPHDPPWVKQQLERYDLERAGSTEKILGGTHSHISEFL